MHQRTYMQSFRTQDELTVFQYENLPLVGFYTAISLRSQNHFINAVVVLKAKDKCCKEK